MLFVRPGLGVANDYFELLSSFISQTSVSSQYSLLYSLSSEKDEFTLACTHTLLRAENPFSN
jgi:hypothetical protein